ncbi:RDD family protein [Bdellovibrio bacteriovorus]
MLFPDLSAPEIKPASSNSKKPAIVSVADRCLALLLDFLIFSPIISLFIAGMVRKTKTFFLLNSVSTEGSIGIVLILVMILALITVLQTVFLYYWQATPGQLYSQIRVVAYPGHQERLTLNQCVSRSFFWCASFFGLALPFLEVLSHPLRRAFHERASDTMVVTLKREADEGPHPIESRFIGSWMRLSFLLLILFGVVGFFKSYNTLVAGGYRDSGSDSIYACAELKDATLSAEARLDSALTLYFLEAVSSECLNKEAEAVLWGSDEKLQGLAYVAKYVLADEENQEKYLKQICSEESKNCALAEYLSAGGNNKELSKADQDLLVVKFFNSEELYEQKNYNASLTVVDELQKHPHLKSALEKRFVRSVWALNETQATKASGRSPASVNKRTWLETFKERYEFK